VRSLIASLLVVLATTAHAQDASFFSSRYAVRGTSGVAPDRASWSGELLIGEQFHPVVVFRATSDRGETVAFSGRAVEADVGLFQANPKTRYAIPVEANADPARLNRLLAVDPEVQRNGGARLQLFEKKGSTWGGRTPNEIEFEATLEADPDAKARNVWVYAGRSADYLCDSGSHYMNVFVQGWTQDLRYTPHASLDHFRCEEPTPFFSGTIARARYALHTSRLQRRAGQYGSIGVWKSVGSERIPRALDALRVRVKGAFRFGEVELEHLDVSYRELSGEVISERGGEVRVEGVDYYSGPILRTATGEEVILFETHGADPLPKLGDQVTVRGYYVLQTRVLALSDAPPPAATSGGLLQALKK